MWRGGFGEMWPGLFGRFGDVFRLLLLCGVSTPVSGFPLFPFQNPRHGVEVVRHKVARLLGRFGCVTPLHLCPATFVQWVRAVLGYYPVGAKDGR